MLTSQDSRTYNDDGQSTFGGASDGYPSYFVPSRRIQSFEFGLDFGQSRIFSADSSQDISTTMSQSKTGGNISSLNEFCNLMFDSRVPGPYTSSQVHLGTNPLGKGAQFEVFGSENILAAEDVYATVDKPYKQVDSDIRGNRRRLVVAIKRPIFVLPTSSIQSDASMGGSGSTYGFGTVQQQRDMSLEVFALTHNPLRSHPNIVKLLAWGIDIEPHQYAKDGKATRPLFPFLIVEHANCTLGKFVNGARVTRSEEGPGNTSRGSKYIPKQVLQHLCLDVARGLKALHDCAIVHGDIKPDNVLLFPQLSNGPYFCVAKLSDFGLAVKEQKERIYNLGTPGWMAPELETGVQPGGLVKCDFFSLGLLILSMVWPTPRTGKCPLDPRDPTAAMKAHELAQDAITTQCPWMSEGDIKRFTNIMDLLLPSDPGKRVSDLDRICSLLEQSEDDLGADDFDKDGLWTYGLFDDDTPWNDLVLQNPDGYTLALDTFEKWTSSLTVSQPGVKTVALTSDASFQSRYAWKDILNLFPTLYPDTFYHIASHYHNSIVSLAENAHISGNLSLNDLIGSEVAMADLMGFCFDVRTGNWNKGSNRLACGLSAAIAAVRGYRPAQAICQRILEGTRLSMTSSFLAEVQENAVKWQEQAVASGFLLAWDFAHSHSREYDAALDSFRKAGAYNTHYIHLSGTTVPTVESVTHGKSGLIYLPPGVDPLPWLTAYPLHHASALGQVDKLEELIAKGFDVNSRDDRGEVPLLKAAMAGSGPCVKLLIANGADPTIPSPETGTYPLHWLFLFPKDCLQEIAELLNAGRNAAGRNVGFILHEKSFADIPAFHFPFRWPSATPVGWAVLANNASAVEILIDLGSDIDAIDDFFPTVLVKKWRAGEKEFTPGYMPLDCYIPWIYESLEDYVMPIVRTTSQWFVQMARWKEQQRRTRNNIRAAEQRAYGNPLINAIVRGVGTSEAEFEQRLRDDGLNGWAQYINLSTPAYGFPLMEASKRGYDSIVRILLLSGADVNAKADRSTALISAVMARKLSTVKLLLGYGANILWDDKGRHNALDMAATYSSPEIVKALIEAAVMAQVDIISPALIAAASRADRSGTAQVEIVRMLISAGADVNNEDHPGSSNPRPALVHAAAYGAPIEVIKLLLTNNANANWRGGSPITTVLHETTRSGSISRALVQLLLDHGADPNQSADPRYGTPLQYAAFYGNSEVVELLLKAGADVNAQAGDYGTALQAASYTGNTKTMRMLLDHGADVNASGVGRHGSAMGAALVFNQKEVVKLLLERGAGAGEYERSLWALLNAWSMPK